MSTLKRCIQISSLWRAVLKRWSFSPDTCGRYRINRRKKSAFSNRNGYVGPGTWGHPFLRVQRTHCLPQSLTEGDHDFQDKVRLLRKHKQSSARSYGHGVACERVFQWWQAKRAARERASKRRRKMIILAIFLASSSYGKYVKKSLEDVKKKKTR